MRLTSDFGPLYTETDLTRFPVEPWNTYTNVIFLICIVAFAFRTRMNPHKFPLLVVSIPILTIGFIGGTVFHATRSHPVWLFLDFMPIFILALLAAYCFWRKLTPSPLLAAAGIVIPTLFSLWLRSTQLVPAYFRISIGYSSLAVTALLPAVIICLRNKFVGALYLFSAIIFFAIAIYFRTIDRGYGAELFPMGTHFLWHLFGGVSVYMLFSFIFLAGVGADDDMRAGERALEK